MTRQEGGREGREGKEGREGRGREGGRGGGKRGKEIGGKEIEWMCCIEEVISMGEEGMYVLNVG